MRVSREYPKSNQVCRMNGRAKFCGADQEWSYPCGAGAGCEEHGEVRPIRDGSYHFLGSHWHHGCLIRALEARIEELMDGLNEVDAVISRDSPPERAFNEIVKKRVEAIRKSNLTDRKKGGE